MNKLENLLFIVFKYKPKTNRFVVKYISIGGEIIRCRNKCMNNMHTRR